MLAKSKRERGVFIVTVERLMRSSPLLTIRLFCAYSRLLSRFFAVTVRQGVVLTLIFSFRSRNLKDFCLGDGHQITVFSSSDPVFNYTQRLVSFTDDHVF